MALPGQYRIRHRQAATFTFVFTMEISPGVPRNLTGWYFKFQVRKSTLAVDAGDPEVSYTGENIGSTQGATGQVTITIDAEDMDFAPGSYVYEISRHFESDDPTIVLPVMSGVFVLEPAVVQ